MQPIPMNGRSLPIDFSLGSLRLINADALPLTEVYWHIDDHAISFRMTAGFPADSSWRGTAMIVFYLFRLPEAGDAASNLNSHLLADAKLKVRLPDKVPFDQTTLVPAFNQSDWEQESYALGTRDLYHVFRGSHTLVVVRLYSQLGTMLDHPLLSFVSRGVILVAGQWVLDEPVTSQRANKLPASVNDGETGGDEAGTFLNLRDSETKVRQFIQHRITNFDAEKNFGPGEGASLVRMITVGFYAEQGGWVAMVFDCRPKAEHDGEWTGYLDDANMLDLTEWVETYEAVFDHEDVTIVGCDGKTYQIADNNISDEELNQLFGDAIRRAVEALQSAGAFDNLPSDGRIPVVIEEFDGRYAWPEE